MVAQHSVYNLFT